MAEILLAFFSFVLFKGATYMSLGLVGYQVGKDETFPFFLSSKRESVSLNNHYELSITPSRLIIYFFISVQRASKKDRIAGYWKDQRRIFVTVFRIQCIFLILWGYLLGNNNKI